MAVLKEHVDILKLFDSKPYLKICAPMVRYSKLQFRTLVRSYGCDLCYTPMILADSFCQSSKARDNEFTTNTYDSPLIAQFAGNTVHDFVGAAHMIAPFCDGVGLNCGCPQRWAKQQGLGCIMLEKPELISDIVKQCRNRIPKPFTVSVKMRILKDLRKTVEICRQLEKAGASFLSVHARTASQLTGDINVEALKMIVENTGCPIVANGGVKTLPESDALYSETKCKGVMVANAILTNPTLFAGSSQTTPECVQNWLDICYNSTVHPDNYSNPPSTIKEKPHNLTFQCFHHHLVFMLEKLLPKNRRRTFNNLQNFADVLQFLQSELGVRTNLYDSERFVRNCNANLGFNDSLYNELKAGASVKDFNFTYENDGKFFSKIVENDSNCDCDLSDIFECG